MTRDESRYRLPECIPAHTGGSKVNATKYACVGDLSNCR